MGRNLGPLNISQSYQGLVQISGSNILTDGTGSLISSLDVTASFATNATSASYATNATSASYALTSTSASYAVSSSQADNAVSSSYALTASFAENVPTVDTGSLLVTASVVDATTTYTKGDGSTFTTTINNVTSSISASFADTATSASYAVTASYAENAVTPTLQQVTDEGATTSNPITITSTAAKTLVTEGGIEISSSTAPTLEIQSTTASLDPSVLFQSGSTYVGYVAGTSTHLELGDFANDKVLVSGSNFEIKSNTTNTNLVLSGSVGYKRTFTITGSSYPALTSIDYTIKGADQGNGRIVLDADGGTDIKNALTASGLNYPTSDGTLDQVLTTDGAGNLTFQDAAGGDPFPYTGSAVITGSIVLTGSMEFADEKVHINPATTLNTTAGQYNVSIGNDGGTVTGNYSTAVGTRSPNVTGIYASTYGGNLLSATSTWASVIGGESNTASGNYSFVGGGNSNTASGLRAVVVGGTGNSNGGGVGSAIMGGSSNTISSALNASIISGESCTISSGTDATIIGSFGSSITSATYAYNIFGSLSSTINAVSNWSANIIGGSNNTISATGGNGRVILVGGQSNTLSGGSHNAILAGQSNTVSHNHSVVIGGQNLSSTKTDEVTVPNLTISGSVVGEVGAITPASNTGSMDCATSNFFTMTLGNAVDTRLEVSNIQVGQTINLKLTNNATAAGTISFGPEFEFSGGTAFTATATTDAVDVLTFISFDGTSLQATGIKNFS